MKILLVMPHPNPKRSIFSKFQYPCLTLQQIAGITPVEHNVEIVDERYEKIRFDNVEKVCGASSAECLRSGLFFSFTGAAREIVEGLTKECFEGRKVICLACGGDAAYFINTGLFFKIEEDLVLDGAFQLFRKYGGSK